MIHDSIWESVDQIINTEFRTPAIGAGNLAPLYRAAREKIGAPLARSAAERLAEVASPGTPIVFITGAGGPPYLFKGETDGPLGLASLARALSLGFGVWPVVVSERRSLEPIVATLVACGLSVLPEEMARVRSTTATMAEFTTDPNVAAGDANVFLDRYRPAAVVVIEKNAPNRIGVIHSATGKEWPTSIEFVQVAALIEEARRRNILTVGIGDQGNEIGFGLIEEAVRQTVAGADVCRCPCGQGAASSVATDLLVTASVSNWGAYAIAAGLAILSGRRELLHDAQTERAMLGACVTAGGVDGLTSRQIRAVDGTSEEAQIAIITLLAELITKSLDQTTVDY